MSGPMAKRRKPVRVDKSALDLGEFAGSAAEEQTAELSWRQDRSKSLSDWTIVVKPEAGGRDHTYHVHKAMIGAGARAAKYFHRCFDSSMAEALNSTSTLTLLPSAIEAFPLYLDFAYTGELEATTDSVCALMHMGDYLDCRALFDAAIAFAKEDIHFNNSAVYLREASLYRGNLEKTMAFAFKLCTENLCEIILEGEDDTLYDLSPEDFLKVVQKGKGSCSAGGEELSICVAKYCRGPYADDVDAKLLSALTEHITKVDPTEAYALLGLAEKLQPPVKKGPTLSARCIAACAENWEQAILPKLEAAPATVQRSKAKAKRGRAESSSAPLGQDVPDAIQIKILEGALVAAAGSLKEKDKEKDEEVKKWKRLMMEVSHLKHQKADALRLVERFKRVPHTFQPNGMQDQNLAEYTFAPDDHATYLHQHAGSSAGQPLLLARHAHRGPWGLASSSRKYGQVRPSSYPVVSRTSGELSATVSGSGSGWVYTAAGSWGRDVPSVKRAMFYFE